MIETISVHDLCLSAKQASFALRTAKSTHKNKLLDAIIHALEINKSKIFSANEIDLENARKNGVREAMIDRLKLDETVFASIVSGIRQTIGLKDPIGTTDKMWLNDDGLNIGIRRVPLGVIGIIYESRPNVTVDAATLCLKTGNAVVLKGGSDAIHSNRALVAAIKEALANTGYSTDTVQLIDSTDRSATLDLLKENKTVDCIIPRGGASLIQFVVNESKVPIIETGTGICHIYVDEQYPHDKAIEIILNAKTQKPGACNAVETVLIHESEVSSFLPKLCTALFNNQVKLHLSDDLVPYLKTSKLPYEIASKENFQMEYLDYELSIASVSNIEEAISHIETYGTHHSDAILTKNYDHAQFFLDHVDSAAVYVNASTRFTDGNAFGYGAEIGISTQKLHARGPMGLEALTTIKYVIYGNDQSRD